MSEIIDSSQNKIIYRVATTDDRDKVLDFLREHYYPYEPITIGIEPKRPDSADEEFTISVIEDGASILAIDSTKNDKIVGAIMAGPIQSDEMEQLIAEARQCDKDNQKWSQILRFLAHLAQGSNIFKRYNVDKSLHIHAVSVDTAYRGKSIGTNLTQHCLARAKSLGYPIVSADCSNVFSIKMVEKLGMNCINVQAFSDYKDLNGRQVFNPPLPNTHIKTFVKVL